MRGFSLIETVVYIAILAVISVIAVNTLLLIHSSLAEIRATRVLNAAAAVAMERTIRTIRDAKAVNVSASTLDSSPGLLSLTGSEPTPLTYVFSRDANGALILNGSALTPPGVMVMNLIFRRIVAGTISEAIKVELTVAASSGRATTTQNFYGTAVLRNSYSP